MSSYHIDLNVCDSEPVNITGAIQPFGALIVLSGEDVVNWSSNIWDVLEISASPEVELKTFFGAAGMLALDNILAHSVADGALPPILLNTRNGRSFNIQAHRHCGRVFLEIEPLVRDFEDRSQRLDHELAALVTLLDGGQLLGEVCNGAVCAIRKMSGYDRVMIYRFHEDMHGEVIAEAAAERYGSWLGLHYPASDIPYPARQIFLLNKLRVIPDVNCVPVPIVGSDVTTLDLARSLLRSVSPIHIEYLKNMHVTASLTVSIKIRGALWGLLACHHYEGSRLPTLSERQKYVMVGDYLSSAIGRRIEDEISAQRSNIREVERNLSRRMKSLPDLAEALTVGEVTALDLMSKEANGFAVRYGETWARTGVTPDISALDELASHLEESVSEEPIALDSLSGIHEQSFTHSEASGVLAISVPDAANALVLWFKPETLRVVNWGGDPATHVTSGSDRLHPRISFAAWTETVRHKSLPWKRWEIEAASSFKDAIIATRLRYQYERERVARAEAERAKRTLEEAMAMISHDLRNPLSSVMMSAALLGEVSPEMTTPTTKSIIATIDRATKQMLWLIDGLLDVAQAESGTLHLDIQRVSATGLVNNAISVLCPIAQAAHIALRTQLPSREVFVKCDEQRILQVLSNLVGNAIKFTPEDGRIDLILEESATTMIFHIVDSGPGIAPDQLHNIFNRFWRGDDTQAQGLGLGLSIVKAIIGAHGREVSVINRVEGGACFSFSLEKI